MTRARTVWMRIGLVYLASILIGGIVQYVNPSSDSPKQSRPLDIGDEKQACSTLRNSLIQIENTTNLLQQEDRERIRRLIREDEAFADAVSDYPELLTPMLSDSEWSQRASNIAQAFWTSAKLAGLDSELGMKLEDAGETWNKRRIARETPPGKTKGRLLEEQLKLDIRLSRDTPAIREACAISQKLLP